VTEPICLTDQSLAKKVNCARKGGGWKAKTDKSGWLRSSNCLILINKTASSDAWMQAARTLECAKDA